MSRLFRLPTLRGRPKFYVKFCFKHTLLSYKTAIFVIELLHNIFKNKQIMTYKHFIAGAMLLVATMPTPAWADGPVTTVNGVQVERVLSKITFLGDNIVLHFNDGNTEQTEDLEAVSITLPTTTGIDKLRTFVSKQLQGDNLTLKGVGRGERIAIYDAGGRLQMQTTASGSDMSLSLAGLKTGVYIVKAGNNIIKFQKQ